MKLVEVAEGWKPALRIISDVREEDLDRFLTAGEITDVDRLKVPERRIERAASRIAGKLLVQELSNVVGPREIEFRKERDRPIVMIGGALSSYFVSFTHSHGLGAAAASRQPVGLDLERFREISPGMTRFFLTQDEQSMADTVRLKHALLHFWSAKEAAFKMTDRYPTLLKVPLQLVDAGSSGLTFHVGTNATAVQTRIIGNGFIAALATGQTSQINRLPIAREE